MKNIPISVLIDRFLTEFQLQHELIDTSLLKEQAIDIARDFTTADVLTHKIALLDIVNTRAKLPSDFKTAISVAYRIFEKKSDCTTIQKVTAYTQQTAGCDLEIRTKCDKCQKDSCECGGANTVEIDVDHIFRMENPWYYNVSQFGMPIDSTDLYGYKQNKNRFKLLRATTDPFHNLSYHLPDCVNLHCKDCDHSYSITPPYIAVDFLNQNKKVELLLAYLGTPTDESGDILIPDDTDAKEAILYGLAYKYFMSDFARTSSQASRILYTEAEFKRDRAIGRFKTAAAIPDADVYRAEMTEINKQSRIAGPTQFRNRSGNRLVY